MTPAPAVPPPAPHEWVWWDEHGPFIPVPEGRHWPNPDEDDEDELET